MGAQSLYKILQEQRGSTIIVTGHDSPDVDSLVSCVLFADLCAFWHMPVRIVLPTQADEQANRVMPRFGMMPNTLRGIIAEQAPLVLVDHHVPLHGGRTIAVIDHHPTLNMPDATFVCIEPCGACALVMLRLMEEAGMKLTTEQTTLAVTALYMDTLALRSSKISRAEILWAQKQVGLLGLDEAWLTREGLDLQDTTRPLRELVLHGMKVYRFSDQLVISSYVQMNKRSKALVNRLLCAVKKELCAKCATLWVFLVHDPFSGCTDEYDVKPDGSVREVQYDRLISRGQDVMPRVEKEFACLDSRERREADATGGSQGGTERGCH